MTNHPPIPELLTDDQLARLNADDLAQLRAHVEHPGVCRDTYDRKAMLALISQVERLGAMVWDLACDIPKEAASSDCKCGRCESIRELRTLAAYYAPKTKESHP